MKNVYNIDEPVNFPRGFTISDNRIEDDLQKILSPKAYCVWRQYLRFWGSDKKDAYPSLLYLANATGLSKKSIREANKELVRKDFIRYTRGNSTRSNTYHYIDINIIHSKYYSHRKYEKENDELTENETLILIDFKLKYNEHFGEQYLATKRDYKCIKEFTLKYDLDTIFEIIKIFFKTKNTYITNSDYSLYFFMKEHTQKILRSEFIQSDIGRWRAQAERIFKEHIYNKIESIKDDTSEWLEKNINLSGANKERDEYIFSFLKSKIERA